IEDRVAGLAAESRREPHTNGARGSERAALEMEDVEAANVEWRHRDERRVTEGNCHRGTNRNCHKGTDGNCHRGTETQSVHDLCASASFRSILAHVSRSDTVRLKTSAPGRESGSTQKYPMRSNWNRLPGDADARLGSAWHERRTSSECGLRLSRNV